MVGPQAPDDRPPARPVRLPWTSRDPLTNTEPSPASTHTFAGINGRRACRDRRVGCFDGRVAWPYRSASHSSRPASFSNCSLAEPVGPDERTLANGDETQQRGRSAAPSRRSRPPRWAMRARRAAHERSRRSSPRNSDPSAARPQRPRPTSLDAAALDESPRVRRALADVGATDHRVNVATLIGDPMARFAKWHVGPLVSVARRPQRSSSCWHRSQPATQTRCVESQP